MFRGGLAAPTRAEPGIPGSQAASTWQCRYVRGVSGSEWRGRPGWQRGARESRGLQDESSWGRPLRSRSRRACPNDARVTVCPARVEAVAQRAAEYLQGQIAPHVGDSCVQDLPSAVPVCPARATVRKGKKGVRLCSGGGEIRHTAFVEGHAPLRNHRRQRGGGIGVAQGVAQGGTCDEGLS